MKESHTQSQKSRFLQQQKRVLETKQSECLKQRQQALNALAAIEKDELKDSADLASAVIHQEMSRKRANDCTREFIKVNQAILNLANGTYGRCETCGKEITIKRLKETPWATKCIPCQETEEAEELLSKHKHSR